MRMVIAPNNPYIMLKETVIFLAGSIEMGTAPKWQLGVANEFRDINNLVVLNPYRNDYDNSWTQEISNLQFNQQVTWELDGIERADIVIFYFHPGTISPISLMELGYVLGTSRYEQTEIIVCCPEGFHRKGNIDIICHRNGIRVVDDLDEAVSIVRKMLT